MTNQALRRTRSSREFRAAMQTGYNAEGYKSAWRASAPGTLFGGCSFYLFGEPNGGRPAEVLITVNGETFGAALR